MRQGKVALLAELPQGKPTSTGQGDTSEEKLGAALAMDVRKAGLLSILLHLVILAFIWFGLPTLTK